MRKRWKCAVVDGVVFAPKFGECVRQAASLTCSSNTFPMFNVRSPLLTCQCTLRETLMVSLQNTATAWRRQCHSCADERADLFDVQSQLTGTPNEDLRQLTTSVEMCPTSVLASACLVAQRKDGWHMMPRSKQQRNSTNVSHILLTVRVECSITCV